MSRKNSQKRRLVLSSRYGRKTVALSLGLAAVLAGLAYWKPMPTARSVYEPTVTSALPMAQSSPTPILTKEYIYAGDRLIATEVPTTEIALIEGDVSPRPGGNGRLTVADWVQNGRFMAGLDTVTPGSEFQRADCAPRSALGGGTITTSDWVQAGRYAAGLDPPTYGGGPNGIARNGFSAADGVFFALAFPPSLAHPLNSNTFIGYFLTKPAGTVASTTRVVRIVSPTFVVGQNGTVIVELDSQGDESGLGLSLSFNASQLSFVSAVKGSDATAATLNVNSSNASSGRVGLALSQPSGQVFSSGTQQVVVATFSPAVNGSIVVSSSNQPVWREVVDVNSNTLTATFTP